MHEIKFTENKIISILNETSTGISIKEICQKYQISLSTYNKWKNHYKVLQTPTPKKRYLKLEEINKNLKTLFKQVCRDKKRLLNAVD